MWYSIVTHSGEYWRVNFNKYFMKEPQSKDHKTQTNSHQYQAARKETISNMSASPNRKAPSHPRKNRKNEDEFPEKPELPKCIVRWFRGFHLHREKPKITDFGMVGLTLLVAFAAFWSAWSFQKQLTDSRNTFAVAQRAWVAPITTELRSESAQNGMGTVFVVPFSNTGKTPAFKVHAWVNWTTILGQITDADPIADKEGMLLPPQGVGNISTPPVLPADVERIKFGYRLYVYGTIKYRDIFGNDHWTQFCFYPGQDLKGFGPCDNNHNGTDDTYQKHTQNPT